METSTEDEGFDFHPGFGPFGDGGAGSEENISVRESIRRQIRFHSRDHPRVCQQTFKQLKLQFGRRAVPGR